MPTVVTPSVSPGTTGGRGRTYERVLVLAAAVILAAVMTWPTVLRFNTGARVDVTDGMYAVWNVAWVARAVTTDPLGVFDSNIFHPHGNTLAYSESNIGAGVIGAPVWMLTNNPFATYNTVVLVGFALSFICTYALIRRLTGSRLAAAIGAIGFAYAPYVYARLPHIQLQLTFGIPLALLALHRLVEQPTIWRGIQLGAALAVAALSSAYYGVLVGLAVGVGIVAYGWWFDRWRQRAYLSSVAAALAALTLLMMPFIPPYLELQQAGFERTLAEGRQYAVNGWGWLASPVTTHQWLLHPEFQGVAFPGVMRVLLGLAGFALVVRLSCFRDRQQRAHAAFYLILGLLSFWLSFGPDAGLYTALFHTFPVFTFLRAVERFAILATLALCVGAGLFIAYVQQRWPVGRRWSGRLAALLAVVLMIGDSWIVQLFYPVGPPVPSVYRALARAPLGAVAEFPFFSSPIDFNRHAHYMFYSTYHWQPLINGYSDHYPADYLGMLDEIAMFPSDRRSFGHLRSRDVKYVTVRLDWYDEARREDVSHYLSYYVAQRNLRRVDSDRAVGKDGTVLFDVELYEIVSYPE
jgi:hypothetical protein